MERTDIYFVEDDTYFNNNVEGVEIHAECLSQDFDDIAWEPIVDDSPIVDLSLIHISEPTRPS